MAPGGHWSSRVAPALLVVLLGTVGVAAVVLEAGRGGRPAVETGQRPAGFRSPAQGPVTEPVTVAVPARTGSDSWIAFTGVGPQGGRELYLFDPDGGARHRIPVNTPVGTSREWAPDGGSIRFCVALDPSAGSPDNQCSREQSVSPYLRVLPSNTYLDTRPKRSPDGRTLAFVRIHDAGSHRAALMTVDIISGVSSTVVDFPANVRPGIDWSPDGRLLAYTANPGGGSTTDLWAVAPDGSRQRQITHLPDDWTASSPTFSPDGTRIAIGVATGEWAAIAIAGVAGGVSEPVAEFRGLVPQDVDWGPAVSGP